MTWRTPPSLKWLIDKRSRLSGMVEQLESRQAFLKEQFELIDVDINKLRQQLSSLDQTFLLHEIQVDPNGLRTIVPHRNLRLVPHGQMTRAICRILRHHEGWASTTQIAEKIAEQLSIPMDKETSAYIHIAVCEGHQPREQTRPRKCQCPNALNRHRRCHKSHRN